MQEGPRVGVATPPLFELGLRCRVHGSDTNCPDIQCAARYGERGCSQECGSRKLNRTGGPSSVRRCTSSSPDSRTHSRDRRRPRTACRALRHGAHLRTMGSACARAHPEPRPSARRRTRASSRPQRKTSEISIWCRRTRSSAAPDGRAARGTPRQSSRRRRGTCRSV